MKITERGWPGHFICGQRCLFRRNTLIEHGKQKVIVSTVGMMQDYLKGEGNYSTIGAGGRYYETMAFKAQYEAPYWDIAASETISFKGEWSICAESVDKLPKDADNIANRIHDNTVKKICGMIKRNSIK